jgi:hypothetical protein
MTQPIGDWPTVSGPHKNGDRIVGKPGLRVAELWRAGRAPVSILLRSSVTELIGDVRIGDELDVQHNGKYWWASSEAGVVGRLTWNRADESRATWFDYEIRYPATGRLHVERLVVSRNGNVVNLNGYVAAE